MALLNAVPVAAQDHPLEVFAGWAPVFADNAADFHVMPAWAVSVGGGAIGPMSPVFEASGWYFIHSGQSVQSIHNFLGGPRYTFQTTNRPRPFVQAIAGATIFHAYGTGFGLAIVPGGGVDLPLRNAPFAIRIQGDYFGTYAPGDYGRHYWGHVWRASTGIVFLLRK